MTPQRTKFKKAVKACWSKMASGHATVSPKGLGACMRKALKGKHKARKSSHRRKSRR